jgi:hypothetical protein
VTGTVEPRDVATSSASECGNNFRHDPPAGGSDLQSAIRRTERVVALDCACNPSASYDASPRIGATVQEPPTVAELLWKASLLVSWLPPINLETTLIEGVGVVCGSCRTQRARSERGSTAGTARSPREVRRGARHAHVFPAKAVTSRGRQIAADRETATCVRSGQRVGSLEQPRGCSPRAPRVGAPRGPEDTGERSDAEVCGARPSSAAKETATLPKVLWGGGRSRGRRSRSGESPKASTGATTKSVHPSISVEGCEA